MINQRTPPAMFCNIGGRDDRRRLSGIAFFQAMVLILQYFVKKIGFSLGKKKDLT
jgi:hypothetical protein